jgi:hypothetical protein
VPGRDVPRCTAGIAMQAGRSRAAAVKLFCLECVGFVRKDISDCTARRCPPFRWRPYSRGRTKILALPLEQFGGLGTAKRLGARGRG